jgi:two-component system, response regulator PdtaR
MLAARNDVLPLRSALVIEPIPAQHSVIVPMLKGLGVADVYSATNEAAARQLITDRVPRAIFAEFSAPGWHAPAFVKTLRRSRLPIRSAPVILISGAWTERTILEARDCGAHECIRKPFSTSELTRRIRAAMDIPRDWIDAESYVGPDRRRFNSGGGEGLDRRGDGSSKSDPIAS